ncbi:MAG: hypothetical protein GF381_01855 [Candidatus Pacebacteria bacterium]|nr:hypothetical protein [Candidatus Paceibacterota bacterium]
MKTGSKPIIIRPQRPSAGGLLKSQQTRQAQAYQQTINQRRRLKAAEYAATEPVKNHLKRKGEMVERRIDQLRSKTDQT